MGAKQHLSEEAFKELTNRGLRPTYATEGRSKNNKYSKERFIKCFRGYDFMENMLVVRPYIQRRYGISLDLLEMLLMLLPKMLFTQADYSKMPKRYGFRSIKNMLNTGYIDVVQAGENVSKEIYTVNRKGIEIVAHFYECLSGEKQIPTNRGTNPMTRATATKFDKKRLQLIKQLNQLAPAVSKSQLFQ